MIYHDVREMLIVVDDTLPGLSLAEPERRREVTLSRRDVPDALWPTDNEWGIPTLLSDYQGVAVNLPVTVWGSVRRADKMRGLWLFYIDDYRFSALWRDPSRVVNSGCVSVAEPNFSIGPQTPRAVALWQIYRKRWLARWWQSYGIRVFVDLNVDVTTFEDLTLLGVPKGWKAYVSRGYTARLELTRLEHELACRHAGTRNILFLLYGGGRKCRELAQELGMVWIPSEHKTARGLARPGPEFSCPPLLTTEEVK